MADIADMAAEHDFTAEILLRHANTKPNEVKRGVCANCDAKLEANLVYCDADCREDHEFTSKMKKRR